MTTPGDACLVLREPLHVYAADAELEPWVVPLDANAAGAKPTSPLNASVEMARQATDVESFLMGRPLLIGAGSWEPPVQLERQTTRRRFRHSLTLGQATITAKRSTLRPVIDIDSVDTTVTAIDADHPTDRE